MNERLGRGAALTSEEGGKGNLETKVLYMRDGVGDKMSMAGTSRVLANCEFWNPCRT